MERKKTMTMSWKGLGDDDDDEHFFESFERAAGGVQDGASSSSDEEFEDSRMSFSSQSQRFSAPSHRFAIPSQRFAVPSQRFAAPSNRFRILSKKASTAAVAVAVPDFDYNMWMAAPGSITERRKKLLHGMGLDENKELLKMQSIAIERAMTRKFESNNAAPVPDSASSESKQSLPDSAAAPPLPPRPKAAAPAATPPPAPDLAPAPDSAAPKVVSTEATAPAVTTTIDDDNTGGSAIIVSSSEEHKTEVSHVPFVLVRSRSDGDVDADSFSMPKLRKEELIGKVSKQRLTKTYSEITLARPRMCPYTYIATAKDDIVLDGVDGDQPSKRHHRKLTSVVSNTGFGSFFLIKNLDTGKEFIVTGKDHSENGTWNHLNDVQTGKKLTMEEFEKSVGHSPVVKELMRRGRGQTDRKLSANHYISKSLKMSKKTGAALFKSMKGVASGYFGERERSEKGEKDGESPPAANLPSSAPSQPAKSDESKSQQSKNEWVKVRQSGKSQKELSALHLCQEFQAHEGCIWTIRFSWDGHYLASAGEDKVIHVWEVQECELTSLSPEEGNLTPLHPALLGSSAAPAAEQDDAAAKKKGKAGNKKDEKVPDYVHVPETVFSLSDKPFCTLKGHSDDILDLSWSKCQLLLSSSTDKTVRLWDLEEKMCLKVFTHNDFVTCIQFNPIDDDYFISGSLDAKVRIWSIPQRHVVDWTDVHEMVTAISYTPDGQAALIGTHNGNCMMYGAEEGKLTQTSVIDLQPRKKAPLRKVTGFQFAPSNPSEVLVTTADCRIKIVESTKVVHKFQGFRNANSQIAASFSPHGRHVISASEDSQVYFWRYDEPRQGSNNQAKARPLVVTKGFESFPCKDVAVAVPWPFTIKGDPPQPGSRNSKNTTTNPSNSKRSDSIAKSDADPANNSKKSSSALPPLPNKKEDPPPTATDESNNKDNDENNNNGADQSETNGPNSSSGQTEETAESTADPSAISKESEVGDSSASLDPSSIKNEEGSSNTTSSKSGLENKQGGGSGHPGAWGLVIATASLGGEIRCYQNFGLPRKVGGSLF
ncbi:WD repeat-containing protein 44-like [Senna tora]|uniref:WD repeat-containing protein 44-like n=1 Tax=Senna tora TaxID=362788 RepID=A0A834WLV8_9FABA|nr:WD repeat-containing protein 44-like [Senna tora]